MWKLMIAIILCVFFVSTCGKTEDTKLKANTDNKPKATLVVSDAKSVSVTPISLEITRQPVHVKPKSYMGVFFVIVSHLVTVVGIVALMYGAYCAITETTILHERIVRGLSVVTGSFAYVAASAVGVSIPNLMVGAVAQGNWFSIATFGVAIPTLAGFFLARFIISCMRQDDEIAVRVMLLITSLVLIMFSDVYIVAAGESSKLESLRPLLPNVTFLLTMMLYVIFEYRPQKRVVTDT